MKIAIISDIHEDIESLLKALSIIDKQQCDDIYCLGDIIGCDKKFSNYLTTRDANQCIDMLQTNNVKTVIGNHDMLHIQKLPEYKAGFDYPENWHTIDFKVRKKLGYKKVWLYATESPTNLNDKSKLFLSDKKEFLVSKYKDINIMFSHNYYPDLSGSLFASAISIKDLPSHFDFMEKNDCNLSFCGHRHVQGVLATTKPSRNWFPRIFQGFNYYWFGDEKIKNKRQYISIPAIADQSQINGFVIFDTDSFELSIIPLKKDKPIFYSKF